MEIKMSLKTTKFIKLFIFLILSPALIISCSDSETSNTLSFATELSADFTVPQVTASGTGTASFSIDLDTNAITGSVAVSDLTNTATAAHIHNAIAGSTGGIVITLEADTTNTNLFNIPDSTTLSTETLTALQNSELYINVHTAANASGEIRGQIIAANNEVMHIELKSENQVPTAVNSVNSGVAFVTLNTSTRVIRGNVKNTGLDDATALHIHDAFAGTNGGIVTGLIKDSVDVSLWAIADNTILTADQLTTIQAGGLYFNAHTPANPTGEVRGQIIPDDIALVRSELTGNFQVPTPINSVGSAVGFVTVNKTSGAVTANVIVDNLSDVTTAHIHSGFAGTNGGTVITLTEDSTISTLLSSTNGDTLDATNLSNFLSGKLYLNVHTSTNAAGDVRGQIVPDNIVVTRDELDGTQVAPSAVTTSATGIGYTTANKSDNSFYANVRNSGLTATAAHVHQGAVGATGGIIVGLTMDATDTNFWSASSTLSSSELDAFSSDEFYFNVHTAANAAGEIRSQINQ